MIALDVRAIRWLHETFSQGGWLALMCTLTVIGGGWGALAIVPLFASPRTRRFAASLTATLAVNAVAVFVLKAIIQRKRPYLAVPGMHALVFQAPTDFSCPSGHAAGSFTFAMFVAVVLVQHARRAPTRKKRRIALAASALTCALGIAMSRCVLGVHYPADVLLGAVLGTALGFAGARWHLRSISSPPRVIPTT